MKRLTKEEFEYKARLIHGDAYDYSLVEYINNSTEVLIICRQCNKVFSQKPIKHLSGHGCRDCKIKAISNSRRMSYNDFVQKSKMKHGDKYDYSKVNYVNSSTKVCIICKKHNYEFWQTPNNHLGGQGCLICGRERISNLYSKDTKWFAERAKIAHGDRYDYSLVEYINNHTKVKIICPDHGAFEQVPYAHLSGHGCPKCGVDKFIQQNTKDTEYFIEKAIEVHGDKYDYSKVEYSGSKVEVCIICKTCGREFYQTPNAHFRGHGCPYHTSYKGEDMIEEFFKENDIKYTKQYRINLPVKMFSRNKIRVDFYLPNHNTIVEFNGIQHYEYIPFFHRGEDAFVMQVERDNRLIDYCKDNEINLIVIKYNQIKEIGNILNNIVK